MLRFSMCAGPTAGDEGRRSCSQSSHYTNRIADYVLHGAARKGCTSAMKGKVRGDGWEKEHWLESSTWLWQHGTATTVSYSHANPSRRCGLLRVWLWGLLGSPRSYTSGESFCSRLSLFSWLWASTDADDFNESWWEGIIERNWRSRLSSVGRAFMKGKGAPEFLCAHLA